jgi:hypothetical protein
MELGCGWYKSRLRIYPLVRIEVVVFEAKWTQSQLKLVVLCWRWTTAFGQKMQSRTKG